MKAILKDEIRRKKLLKKKKKIKLIGLTRQIKLTR
jgi:hypothetical protein